MEGVVVTWVLCPRCFVRDPRASDDNRILRDRFLAEVAEATVVAAHQAHVAAEADIVVVAWEKDAEVDALRAKRTLHS